MGAALGTSSMIDGVELPDAGGGDYSFDIEPRSRGKYGFAADPVLQRMQTDPKDGES